MFRIGLSVYLMLATLVGPWLCCCQMSRFSARFVSLLRYEKSKPFESRPSCCQHRVPVKDSQPTKLPDAPSCPCQGKGQEAPALVVLQSDGTRQVDRDPNAQAMEFPDTEFLLSGVATSSINLVLNASSLPSPVLTGRDILSSLHILRC